MDLKRIIHPIVTVADTDDTKYDKFGRVSEVRKDGKWNLKMHKDLKNATPDGDPKNLDNLPMFCKGDLVSAKCTSLYGVPLDGDFFFDSYDKWDNTCFISKRKDGNICNNVLLSDITLFDRNDKIKTMIKERDKKNEKK